MFEAAWEGIYIFFLQICASSKSPDPPSENHDLGEIYSRLNHKPLECVNMYLKQIFWRKMSHYSICNSCCLCKGKMWDLCYTLHKQGMEGKDWNWIWRHLSNTMEQNAAEAQGKFHSEGGREEKKLEGKSVKKYILSHFLFFFLKPKSTWHSVKRFSKWVLL